MKRFLAAVSPLILAIGLAACSPAAGAQPASPAGQPGTTGAAATRIVAKDIAFQQTTLAVDAGKAFDLQFVNQDGAPHNVAIYTDASAASPIMVGEIIQTGETTYKVPALSAGTYFFRCDVHPDMKGSIATK